MTGDTRMQAKHGSDSFSGSGQDGDIHAALLPSTAQWSTLQPVDEDNGKDAIELGALASSSSGVNEGDYRHASVSPASTSGIELASEPSLETSRKLDDPDSSPQVPDISVSVV